MKKNLLSMVLVVLLLLLVPMRVSAAETKQEDNLIATVVISQGAINIVPNQQTIDQDILSVLLMPYNTNEEVISNWVRLYVTNHYNAYKEKRSWLLVTYNSDNVQIYIFKGDQSFANMMAKINPANYEKVSFGHFVDNVGISEKEETLNQSNIPGTWNITEDVTEYPLLEVFLQSALEKDGSYVYSYSSETGETWEKSSNREYHSEYASENYYWAMW